MAFPWSTVIGAIPWTDLVKAAPELARRARRVLGRSDAADDPSPPPASAAEGPAGREQIEALVREIAILKEHQRQSDEVLRALADQHDALVRAGEALRQVVRRLRFAVWALAAVVVALLVAYGLALWR